MRNTLYYGDNLYILRQHIRDDSVDLIYLDPPFNSQRSYNVLFKQESGKEAEAQETAFVDTWHWTDATQAAYQELVTQDPERAGRVIASFYALFGRSQMTAYLVMMAARLVELHRVLKPTGSLYLHCDPTASHYLKILLDTIFGVQNYRNEIVWQRTNVHSDSKTWSHVSDIIFFYTKSNQFTFNPIYAAHSDDYVGDKYRYQDTDGRRYTLDNMTSPNPRPNMMYEWKGHASPPNGWRYSRETMAKLDAEGRIWYPADKAKRPRLKRYLDEMPGRLLSNIWADIFPINSQAQERLGYPTQKPVALLERIIAASSNPGDLVLDPFCGCGTTIAAAQTLARRWIGIDITHLAILLQKVRLESSFSLEAGRDYDVVGEPMDVGAARQLATENRYQFQWWALSLIDARPYGAAAGSKKGKKGADAGIDGLISFIDDATQLPKRVLVQVKSGHVGRKDIAELVGNVKREDAAIGAFITLEPPTRPMIDEALAAGYYQSPTFGQFPKIQILTIEELLHRGKTLKMPPRTSVTFKRAEKVRGKADHEQTALDLD